MDYSASVADGENPAGPWGSSPVASPNQPPATFAPVDREQSSSPTPFSFNPAASPHTLAQDPMADDGGFGRPSAHDPTSSEGPGTPFTPGAQPAFPHSPQPYAGQQDPLHSANQGQTPAENPAASATRSPQDTQQRRPIQPLFKLQAKITGLERTGKKDPLLRFDVHTNLPRFRTTQYRDVRRMHSEFVKLAEHLISANPDALVHAVPPPLTSAGAGTEEDEARVKALMQRWLNYTCSNETLMRDDEMVLFVESDFGYSPMVKMKQPATGVRRKILKQFAPPPDDTPELQDARPTVKLFYLGSMDAGHKVDKQVKARRGLGLAEADFGVKLGNMHVQELHPGLANAYRKLGKVVQTVGDFHAAQATAEATTIGDPFQYHSQDAFIVKETLTNRQILIREFLQAQETRRQKLNSADRLKASSNVRREKVDEAIQALGEAQQNEQYLQQKTTRVTQNLVKESRKWFSQTSADLRMSIRECVLREIEAERRTLALLESVRPDIRAIDASGGLSRLGREAHPPVRRTSAATSQGPKGDAWSGVPRRSDAANRNSTSASLMGNLPEDGESEFGGAEGQAASGAAAAGAVGVGSRGGEAKEEDDEDRLDARNAASRLATSTF